MTTMTTTQTSATLELVPCRPGTFGGSVSYLSRPAQAEQPRKLSKSNALSLR